VPHVPTFSSSHSLTFFLYTHPHPSLTFQNHIFFHHMIPRPTALPSSQFRKHTSPLIIIIYTSMISIISTMFSLHSFPFSNFMTHSHTHRGMYLHFLDIHITTIQFFTPFLQNHHSFRTSFTHHPFILSILFLFFVFPIQIPSLISIN